MYQIKFHLEWTLNLGKGPYKCLKCDREFSRISSLKNHVTFFHPKENSENIENPAENPDLSEEYSNNIEENSENFKEVKKKRKNRAGTIYLNVLRM